MREYKVGEHYNFWVKGLSSSRIYLEDDWKREFAVYAYKFQTDWDWSSPQVPVGIMRCYVKEIHSSGTIVLEQSKDVLLKALYPEACRNDEKTCRFSVAQLKTINGRLFYVVEDAYGLTHLYKPSDDYSALQPGDEVELNVKSFIQKDNNRSHLILEDIRQVDIETDSVIDIVADDTQVGPFGEENDKIEFKTTIVYPAGATKADIDTQMRIILQTIAGFMNAKGGTLYIGVNDNGEAVGIESEYCMLNSSLKDKYTYQQNKDGYENKIRTAMNRFLGPVAQDYVTIQFLEKNGHTVCVIEVESSRSVIWLDEFRAFKRMGNSTHHLRSEAIVKLVLDKMEYTRPAFNKVEPIPVKSEDDLLPADVVTDVELETEPMVVKVAKPATIKSIGEERKGHGSFYMNMFNNGEWSWSKGIPSDSDLEYCIPIDNPASKNDLIIIYSDGCVNRVNAYKLHRLKSDENRRYPNGRRSDGAKVVKVFHAKAEDLLGCFTTQYGHKFVKVHPVSHISQHTAIGSKGVRVINMERMDGITSAEIFFVSSEHDQRVSALKKTENQVSNSLGIQMDLKKNSKFIHVVKTLEALCDIPE